MNKPLRVWMLIWNFYPFIGGAERQCLKLSKALIQQGVQVRVITHNLKKRWLENDIVDTVPVTRLPFFFSESIIPLWMAYLRAHRNEFDVIHVHLLHANTVAGVLSGRWLKKPVVVKIANSGQRFDLYSIGRTIRWPLRTWIRQAVFSANAVVAICRSIQGELIDAGIGLERIAAIPNGVELLPPVTEAIKRQRRKELNLPQDAYIVIRVGTLQAKKGVELLLKAWQQVTLDHTNAFLVSIGGDNIPAELKGQASSTVRFVLNQPDGVLPYLQAADLFVLPSYAEGLSNALLEAQVCGLPAVVTRVGGNQDIIQDNENGLLVEPGNAEQLAQSINALIASPELRSRMSEQSYKAASRFDINVVAKDYKFLYQKLLKINHSTFIS